MYLSFLYRFYLGSKFTVVVTDLDIMKEVFVKQFDNFADRGSFAVSFEVTEGVHAGNWLNQQKIYILSSSHIVCRLLQVFWKRQMDILLGYFHLLVIPGRFPGTY